MAVTRTTRRTSAPRSGQSENVYFSDKARAALIGLNHWSVIEEAANVTGKRPEDIAQGLGEILDTISDNIDVKK